MGDRGDLDPARVQSNTFTIEWPPGSGSKRDFPEIDRVEWCEIATARRRLVEGQAPLLEALERRLSGS